jgi:Uma2 family endonuclease
MTVTARDRLTSAEFEAFLKLPENQERRFELHNGQIIPKMAVEHSAIVADLVFWLKCHLAEHLIGRPGAVVTESAVPVMPDLAVQVKARHQTHKLQHGTRAIWLVFPEKQLVETYTSAEQGIFLAHQMLTGSDWSLNFSLAVAEIFQV